MNTERVYLSYPDISGDDVEAIRIAAQNIAERNDVKEMI